MMNAKICVLMSTYNGEKYIREQIESILSQTYNVELFVRDDGSCDSTQSILKTYANNGVLRWYTGENIGAGKSFFDLVQKAPLADYYAFADQDDVWDSTKIEIGVKKLAQFSNIIPNMYCSAFTPVDANLQPIVYNKLARAKPSLGRALLECIAPGCTYIFNRKALEDFRKYKMDYITIHDWDLYRIVMALGGNVVYDDESHILYRQHGNNNIGFQSRGLYHWYARLQRFFSGKICNTRYNTACHIKECFYSIMPEQNKMLISVMTDYQKSFSYRMRLAMSSEFVSQHKIDNLLFSILALLKGI